MRDERHTARITLLVLGMLKHLVALQAPTNGADLTAISPAELETATAAALDFAPRWNAWQSRIAGCCSLLKAWKATVTVRCASALHAFLLAKN